MPRAALGRSLPDVEHALLQLNDEQLALCQTNPRLLPQWVPGLRDLVDWWEDELDEPPTGQEEPAPLPQMRGVPARKQEQISRFIHTLFEHCTPAPEELWVEWCAGKGYLARALQHMAGARVRCLERSSRILRSGAKHRGKQDLEFRECDVMTDAVQDHLVEVNGVVALHACGTLTDRLLEMALEMRLPNIAVSPCCYHAGAGKERIRWSTLGKARGPRLSSQDLRLVTAETVHARPALRLRRERELAFRLGLEEWRFLSTGISEYTPQGSYPSHFFEGSFSQFVAAGSERLGLQPPQTSASIEELAATGRKRARDVQRLGLLRGLFRRPLEKWINLDRTIGLQERGALAKLTTFCSGDITPGTTSSGYSPPNRNGS